MIARHIQLPTRGSYFLFGPRQTGKSTLIRSILPPMAWFVDLLHHDDALRYAKDPSQFGREAQAKIRAGIGTIVIDEVQKVPPLLDEVHALIESDSVRFILTGSSARKLRRGGVNLLAGRAAMRHLHPLTASEQADRFDLNRTLRFGSLPAVVTRSDEEARERLAAYAQMYLREEVQAESLVRNLGGFARFLDVTAAQCGDILNYNAVGRDASLAARTVQEYFQILEDTLIGFRLPAWRKSQRGRLVTHPRFYLFDTGITNALNRRLTGHLHATEMGRLFEQWIVLECLRQIDNRHDEAQLFYWRTNHGAEVDLLVEKHGQLRLAVEIKFKTRVVGADCTGLRTFATEYPDVPCVLVSQVPHEFVIGQIRALPYMQFLGQFSQWLS